MTEPSQKVDPALERVAERIQKLLALGRRGGAEAEAAAAMAKANELLTAHNLEMAQVEGVQAGSAKREKHAQLGGMYLYQRELWNAVARLNFCLHFRRYVREDDGHGHLRWRSKHLVVGRTVNVRATVAMAEYLEQVIDRMCRERLATRSGAGVTDGAGNSQFFSSWAVGYRQGAADRVVQKVWARHDALAAAEEEKRKEAERAQGGASTSTTLSLQRFISDEQDANVDFMYGEGTSAEWASRRAERAAAEAEADAAHAAWAAAHPEEAAREEAKRAARARWRAGKKLDPRFNRPGYWSGYDAGEKIGIDPQAAGMKKRSLV